MFQLNLLLFKWTFSVCWKFGKFIWKSQCFFQCWFCMLFRVFKYWILEKAISDQLKYTILLKLALLELPHCLTVLSYLSQHTLNTWVWLFLDTNKMDLWRNKAVLYSTDLYEDCVLQLFFILVPTGLLLSTKNLNFGTNFVIFKKNSLLQNKQLMLK
jgi:hypothetical protein